MLETRSRGRTEGYDEMSDEGESNYLGLALILLRNYIRTNDGQLCVKVIMPNNGRLRRIKWPVSSRQVRFDRVVILH